MPEVDIRRVGYGHPDAALLIAEVQAEYVVRYGGQDETPLDPLMFEPPDGSFYVGYVDGDPVLTGAWRRSDTVALGSSRCAEVKRMYVAERVRGHGLGRMMLAHLETGVVAYGIEVVVLETGLAQPEAIGLYESSGYEPIPPFGFYRCAPLSRCYAKRLAVTT
ncbi:GNAT family N-acetyltransferase [Nocardioides sp. CN2-186]|uniref:GNAT family N-acetyltransferase n=1 Tax=Nocardioides tweenelious TaxID=3156607 RepID=UPI0032B34F3A